MAKINESDLKARVARLNQKIDEIAPLIPLALGGIGGYFAGQKNANAAQAPVQDANVAPAPAPVEVKPDATKLARLKELLAKAGIDTTPVTPTNYLNPPGSAPFKLGSNLQNTPTLTPKTNEGFARDTLLEKLRLIESTQLNEDLSAEEYKEMMRLAAELATDFPNNKEAQTLLQQAQSLPPKWSSDAQATVDPVVTSTPEKPKKTWAKGVLGAGMSGPEVKALQAKLIAAGYLPAGADDGAYGKNTRDAVIALQTDLGVAKDGAYGPATKAAFDAKPDTKKGGAEAPKEEPAKVEPAKVEPAKVEPAKVEPAKVEPAKVEPPPAPVADPKNDAKWMSVNQKNIDSWVAAVKAGTKTLEQVPAPYKFYVQQATAVKESVSYGEDQALARIVSLARF
jgi:hypothetical protein